MQWNITPKLQAERISKLGRVPPLYGACMNAFCRVQSNRWLRLLELSSCLGRKLFVYLAGYTKMFALWTGYLLRFHKCMKGEKYGIMGCVRPVPTKNRQNPHKGGRDATR